MGQEDVLVEVIINGKDMLQFYSTKENYKILYEDRDALVDTVKNAFREGVLCSDEVNVEDIQTVQFLNEVADVTVDPTDVSVVKDGEVEGAFETYQVVEEQIENVTEENIAVANITSSLPEEIIVDVGINPDERLNMCSQCDYRTFNIGHFKIHMRQHTGEAPFECNLCDYKSKQKSNLKRHMRQHVMGRDHFECKMCSFACSNEKMFKRHMILHSRTRPLRPCPFCDYFSTSLAHLTVHIRQHTGETPYHCGLCNYKTVQKSNLTRHLKKHRRGRISKADKLRCCAYCSYRTPNPAHLMAHIRAAHTGETPFECHICEYKSAQRSNLKRHLRKHSGERPFKCHICSYSTAYPYVLKKHIENHPLKMDTFSCSECDYKSSSSIDLKRHMRSHSGKPIHVCYICGYISLSLDHLKNHLRIHSAEKPFRCRYCSYGSAQVSNLKRHYQIKHPGATISKREILASASIKPKVEDVESSDNMEGNISENHDVKENLKVEDESYLEGGKVLVEMAQGPVRISGQNDQEVVVNEENVITTPVEPYKVIEEYIEVESDNNPYHSSDSEQKSNLKLNKKQAEKLREFKRLLQEGTAKAAQNLVHFSQSATSLAHQEVHSGDVDDGSEKTESCPEDPLDEEPPQHTAVMRRSLGTKHPRATVAGQVIPENVNQTEVLNQLVTEGSSILIVEHTVSESGEYEFYECEAEEVTPDGGPVAIHSCELCGFKTNTISELKKHIGVHTGEVSVAKANTPYFHSCDECEFRALRKLDVGRHKALFHGVKPPPRLTFVCRKCPFKTASKEDFIRHSQNHKSGPIKCSICEKKFLTMDEVETHLKTHIGEEPFECYHCAYLSARKSHLKKHILRKHSDLLAGDSQPLFSCYTCGFETTRKPDFLNHIGEHKSEANKVFRCQSDQCRFITLDADVFFSHQQQHAEGIRKMSVTEDSFLSDVSMDTSSYDIGMKSETKKYIKRTPLKEKGNLIAEERKRLLNAHSAPKRLNDDFTVVPAKKKRKALSTLDPSLLIDQNLKRNLDFNPSFLAESSSPVETGFMLDFTGEVYKGHGSLKRFSHYGQVMRRDDSTLAVVLSHPDNEEQLKSIYLQLKKIIEAMKAEPRLRELDLTIYFREMEESLKREEEISDLDITISSDDDASDILKEADAIDISDSDLDLSDDEVMFTAKKTPNHFKNQGSKYPRREKEIDIDMEESEQLELLRARIQERNEKRKELRRIKAKNFSMEQSLDEYDN